MYAGSLMYVGRMKINSSFTVEAPPDEVFAYLLDVSQVVGCVPGAQLSEVVDSQTFTGTLKVKVGAVQITYQGTAHIVDTEEVDDRVTVKIDAKGKEVGGQGTVRASVGMTVARSGSGGSEVSIETDLSITGKIAQFGRGVIEDVSRKLVGEMAKCISANLQAAPTG
jgi:carbon monoxide dehydrogenase subunit G